MVDYAGCGFTVIDCGLLDVCPPSRQARYAAAPHRACRAGGHVYLLELSAESMAFMRRTFVEMGVPERYLVGLPMLTGEDIRTAFAVGWHEEWIEESTMRVRRPGTEEPALVPALRAAFQRR